MKRICLTFLALLAFSPAILAVKAPRTPVTVCQPDGTTLTIRLYGDENRSWKTTLDGTPVFQDGSGWWRTTDSLPPALSAVKMLNPEGGTLAMFLATKAQVRVRTLVIPVQFRDRRFTVPSPRTSIYNLFNQQNYSENGATGSVLDYFRDNLAGSSVLTFDVCDVVTLPNDEKYYGANVDGVTDKNIRQMVVHACEAAHAAGVDFSRYDFDGDGAVDNVFLMFAGHNEAEGGGDNAIWPQSWNIAEAGLVLDGLRVSNFSLYSEYSGASGYRFAGIGTICHEYCHFLGLNDLYDVNDAVEGDAGSPLGPLSIMDQGNYNNEGRTPPYLTIFERQQVGVVTQRNLTQPVQLTLGPVQESKYAWTLQAATGEDFWMEYRDASKWDAYIGGSGLVVYHVDRSNNPAGSMTAKMRWSAGAVNACAAHPCAIPVSSTGSAPETVSDVFFPGPRYVTDIHSTVNFPLKGWNGRGIGYGLSDITRSPEGITFRVVVDESWDLPEVTGYSIVPGQTSALLVWQVDKTGMGQWNIRWGLLGGVEVNTGVIGNQLRYVFEDLEPGGTYFCELFFTRWDVTGKSYRIEFSALNRLSDYPLIGGLDRVYRAGETLHLILLNVTEDGIRTDWSVDGQPCQEGEFTFPAAGSYRITAQIVYPDGSKETLTKILDVKDAQ
ncbi:MAG: M6 family metalloprotease domain-containing protein [Bacteroidales bacterium]|nr:M6 family metalloprotease domain-containing protein [Bacteroidales bacterium]